MHIAFNSLPPPSLFSWAIIGRRWSAVGFCSIETKENSSAATACTRHVLFDFREDFAARSSVNASCGCWNKTELFTAKREMITLMNDDYFSFHYCSYRGRICVFSVLIIITRVAAQQQAINRTMCVCCTRCNRIIRDDMLRLLRVVWCGDGKVSKDYCCCRARWMNELRSN